MHKTASRTRHHKTNHYDLYADLEKIRDAFSDTAMDVKGKTGDMISQSFNDVKDKTIQARENVADYAAEKPFKTLGIALLTGLVIGYIMRK